MGIEDVASFAGCTQMDDRATIRSTLSRTKSAASSGSRAVLPSVARNSIRMFWPSTQPRSRRPDRKACHRRASAGSEALLVRTPTRYTFPGCCASTATGAARETMMRRTTSHSALTLMAPYAVTSENPTQPDGPSRKVRAQL